MREYEKTIATYETTKISKCTCDKCGKLCEAIVEDNYTNDKRTLLHVQPFYSGDSGVKLDLCPNCTRELLAWFPKNEDIEYLISVLDVWEEE